MTKHYLIAALAVAVALPTFAQEPNKTEGIGKVLFIGDSITAGVGAGSGNRYSTVTTRLLQEKHPNAVEVNQAQSGRALCQQAPGYAESLLQHEPDALVVQWGVNDQYWGFSVAEFTAKYDALVKTIRSEKPEIPIVLTTLVADFRWAEGLDLWLGQANIAIQEIAARYGCRVAYIHRAIDHDRKFYADDIHPNAAGAEQMAKAIVAAFESEPLSKKNLAIQFDQGQEVRFMQYVFVPDRGGIEPRWVRVNKMSKHGIQIDTCIPLSVRTPSQYQKNATYQVVISDASGKEVHSSQQTAPWSRMLQFHIVPNDAEMPLDIKITPVESATK